MSAEMYGILGTILGVIIGAPVTYYYAKKMFLHQRNIEAASIFREAFFDELILCKKFSPENDDMGIINALNQDISKHNKAIIRYRPFVPDRKLEQFDKACEVFTKYEAKLNV